MRTADGSVADCRSTNPPTFRRCKWQKKTDHRLTADKNYNFGNLLRVAVVAEWSFNMNCCNTQSTKRQSMLCVIVNKRVNRPSHKRITHASCGVDTLLRTGMSRCGLHLCDILSQENASGDNKTVSFSGTKILRNMAVNWIKANLWNRWEAYSEIRCWWQLDDHAPNIVAQWSLKYM